MMKFFNIEPIYAHCDIPCGIYDPHLAQVAAITTLRMVDLIKGLEKEDPHKIARFTSVKEEHAELCKHEVRVLWGDYFKPEHAEKYPELHDLIWKIMKKASAVRQGTDKANALQLIELVNKLAEIFWETKGVKTMKMKAPYPVEAEMVLPTA